MDVKILISVTDQYLEKIKESFGTRAIVNISIESVLLWILTCIHQLHHQYLHLSSKLSSSIMCMTTGAFLERLLKVPLASLEALGRETSPSDSNSCSISSSCELGSSSYELSSSSSSSFDVSSPLPPVDSVSSESSLESSSGSWFLAISLLLFKIHCFFSSKASLFVMNLITP